MTRTIALYTLAALTVFAVSLYLYRPLHITHTTTYRVKSGDTVWSVSNGNERVETWIEQHNHIVNGDIVPNEVIVVPEQIN